MSKSCFLCGKKLGFFADTFGKYTLSQEKKPIPKGFGDEDVICLDCLEPQQKLEEPRKQESKPNKNTDLEKKKILDVKFNPTEEDKKFIRELQKDSEKKKSEDTEIGKLDRVFCSSCGNEETSDKRFCSKCGEELQVFDDEDKSSNDKDESHKEPFKIHPAGWGLIFLAVLIVIGLTWAFTGNDRETVYDESHCRYLLSLGEIYEEKGVYGTDNIAMSDYKKNCR